MSMLMEKATPVSLLVTLPGLLRLHAGCHRGDVVRSRAHRDGSRSDQEQREKPGMVLLERAGARGSGHSGGQGQGVPDVGSCPLAGPPRGCHRVATPTTHPALSAPRDVQCSPRMRLQPRGHFWVLSVPFMGQHGTKCRLDHGAV